MIKKGFLKLHVLIVCIIMFGVFSCTKSDRQQMKDDEVADRAAYIKENNIPSSAKTSSGLYYVEIEEGEGDLPAFGDLVKVWFTGYFLDGEMFDSNESEGRFEPLSFYMNPSMGTVIQGLYEGVAKMKEGGKARLIIPSDLAYGSVGSLSIPPYTTLVFDVELDDIIKSDAQE